MDISIPEFERGIHFKEQSPDEGGDKYRYKTKKSTIVCWSGFLYGDKKISFVDKNGKEWLYIDAKRFIIAKNYAWDGASPKKHIPIFGWVGTPDTENTILGTLIHDAFAQFMTTEHFPFGQSTNNKIFRHVLKKEGFPMPLYWLYYGGVALYDLVSDPMDYGGTKSIILTNK